jgi:hypothetical protein
MFTYFKPQIGAALLLSMISWTSASTAEAAFVEPTSWTRGTGGATYQEWDVFDGYPTDNTPDIGNVNDNGTASLTETTGQAFVTSGGNVYSFSVPTFFEVTIPELDVPTPAHNVTAILQVKTQGTELDYSSLKLNGLDPVDSAELSRVSLGGFGGNAVESWFLFDLPYAAFGTGSPGLVDLLLTFNASGSSMSLDRLSIDTSLMPFGFYGEPNPVAVPEPTSAVLLALGMLMVARRRRR